MYGVPLAPFIWVEGPAGVVAGEADEVSDEAGDDAAEVLAEDEDPLLLLWLHAEPTNPNAAIAMENAAVRFVISRISFLSNWISILGRPISDSIARGVRPARLVDRFCRPDTSRRKLLIVGRH
ncbi:hypothetical protein [Mycobacterium sp.]|uniref:hypothetical protein n=1 Tax=Mycobacterium sp. TaxID=1785 RepID=UPI0025F9AB06|nr:hypothetical protein [Mycobacterium sp.]